MTLGTKDGLRASLLQSAGMFVLIWVLLGFICVSNATAVALVQITGDPTPYQSLQVAYDGASSDAQIQARDLVFSENLILDRPIDLHIEGGLSSGFVTVDGYTTLGGILTVQAGSLILDNLIIEGLPVPPAAPTGVVPSAGYGEVTLTWNAVNDATSYNIYWSATSGVTPANGTKITGATSPYIQTGLTNGIPIYYVMTAVNGNGESAPSSQVSATPLSTGLPLALWLVEGAPASAQTNSTYSTSSAVTEITAAAASPSVDNASASATFTTDANGNPATFFASNFSNASLTSPVSLLSSGSGLGATNFTSESDFKFGNQTSNGTVVIIHSLGSAKVTGFNTTGLSYSDYGVWSLKPTGYPNPPYVGVYAVGNSTPTMPSSGSTTYSGRAAGVGTLIIIAGNQSYNFSGAISLTANFGTGTVTGTITGINMYSAPSNNTTTSGTINDINLTGTISGTGFSGTITASASAGTLANTSGAVGTFTGNFYGSSSAIVHEVALTMQMPGGNGSNFLLIGGAGAH